MKDHEKGFTSNPSFRLINQSKSNIGKISKKILDKIKKEPFKRSQSQPMEKYSDSLIA